VVVRPRGLISCNIPATAAASAVFNSFSDLLLREQESKIKKRKQNRPVFIKICVYSGLKIRI